MKTIISTVLILFSYSLQMEAGVVKISGSLKQFGLDRVSMNRDGIAAEVYNDKTIEIVLDSSGWFDLKLKLNQPTYYKVGQNLLYLSPGDDLEIIFNRTTTKTTFQGKGAEANRYLKLCSQLSGWDIGKIGQRLNQFGLPEQIMSFDLYCNKTDSIIHTRLQTLEHLNGVTPEFKEMERIRQKASRLMAYLDYFSVGHLSEYKDAPEVKLEKKKAFYQAQAILIQPLLEELCISDRYLELSEVRNVLQECVGTQVFCIPQSVAFTELMSVLKKAEKLDQGLMLTEYRQFTDFSRRIRNRDLRSSFAAKLKERTRLMEGRPAVDILFWDIDGKERRLSDFKGKMLYVDFWATWCLPCLAQLPDFERLSEKYPDIQFIGISIDQKVDWWKKKLKKDGIPLHVKEFLANPYLVGEAWDISSIPRFLLIDEDFKIINAFAPRPAEKEKIEPLLRR